MRSFLQNKGILLVLLTGLFSPGVHAQNEPLKNSIYSRQFKFIAETANSSGGTTRQLSAGYEIIVNKSMIEVYLPYFGKANTPATDLTNGGFQFTSISFTYNESEKEKGWEIKMKPRDATDLNELNLTVFENGSASLDVISLQRDPISYSGHIESSKKKK